MKNTSLAAKDLRKVVRDTKTVSRAKEFLWLFFLPRCCS